MEHPKSKMASNITAYLNFRVSVGLSPQPYRKNLGYFDAFCAAYYPELDVPSKEAVLHWRKHQAKQKSCRYEVEGYALRSFAKYLRGQGKDAYVLPINEIDAKSSFHPYILSDDDLSRLLRSADALAMERLDSEIWTALPVLLRLLATCGLRPNEGRLLLRENINFNTGEVLITKTKHHKERMIIMSDEMLTFCQDYGQWCKKNRIRLRQSGWPTLPVPKYMFTDKSGNPFSDSSVRYALTACWRSANGGHKDIPHIRPYDLRHRFASAVLHTWLNEGKDLYAMFPYLQTYMGHNNIDSTIGYVHLLPENLLSSKGVSWDELQSILPEASIWTN